MARPGDHPDADLLADLAAEVLPEDLARRVEAHVLGCEACAGRLAEAEGIRVLLRRQSAPAMPEDVADRIGAAIAGLRLGPAAGDREGLDDDPEADERWAAAASRGAVGASRGRRGARAPDADAMDSRFTVRRKVERGREASVTRLRRVTGTPARPRREALDEQRSAERAGRIGKVVLGAAAALVVVAAGGVALRALDNRPYTGDVTESASRASAGDSGDSSAAGSAAPQPEAAAGGGLTQYAAGAPVLVSGGNYTDAALPAQAKQLVAAAAAESLRAASKYNADAGGGTPAPAPQASAGVPAGAPATGTAGNERLRDPAALRACLGALNAADEQVVAVDLARYNGRESAVIVLRATGGDYDVWIVARDCRPGADGTLKYLSMAP